MYWLTPAHSLKHNFAVLTNRKIKVQRLGVIRKIKVQQLSAEKKRQRKNQNKMTEKRKERKAANAEKPAK